MKKINTFLLLTSCVLSIVACSTKKTAVFSRSAPIVYGANKIARDVSPAASPKATVNPYTPIEQPDIAKPHTGTPALSHSIVPNSNPVESLMKPKYEQSVKKDNISKKELKGSIKQSSKTNYTVFMTILLVVLAIIIPPVAVLLVDGARGPFWLSILLTILFYLPGIIYAFYRIFKRR